MTPIEIKYIKKLARIWAEKSRGTWEREDLEQEGYIAYREAKDTYSLLPNGRKTKWLAYLWMTVVNHLYFKCYITSRSKAKPGEYKRRLRFGADTYPYNECIHGRDHSSDVLSLVMDEVDKPAHLAALEVARVCLPPKQKVVIDLMLKNEGISQYEMAKILGITQKAVSSRYQHALTRLKELMECREPSLDLSSSIAPTGNGCKESTSKSGKELSNNGV